MRETMTEWKAQDAVAVFCLCLCVSLLGVAPGEAGHRSFIDMLQPIEGAYLVGVFDRAELDVVAEGAGLLEGVSATALPVGIIEVRVTPESEPEALNSLLADERVAWLVPLYQSDDSTIWATNSFVVKLQENVAIEDLAELQVRVGAVAVNPAQIRSNSYVVELSRFRSLDVLEALRSYLDDRRVLAGEPVFFFKGSSSTPNDPLYPKQWALKNNGNNIGETSIQGVAGADIDAELAWDITIGDASVAVAIVDTGVDHSHQDLYSNLDAGADFAVDCSAVWPPGNASCDGLMDGHGTNCAGMAAATQNDGYGVTGIAPGVRIIPIRIGCDQYFNNLWAAQGISWAWSDDGGADVISISWGNRPNDWSTLITDAIEAAAAQGRQGRGAAVVAATGNDNSNLMDDTAATPGSIAVNASSPCDEVKRRSPTSCDGATWGGNWGPQLGVVAPGVFTYSTDNVEVPPNQCGFDPDAHNEGWGGTSGATPLVAGAAALLLSIDNTLPADGIRGFLADTSEQVKVWTGSSWTQVPDGVFHEQSGWGRINAYQAVLAVSNRNPYLVHVNSGNVDTLYPNQVKETGTSQANGFNTFVEGMQALASGGQMMLAAGYYYEAPSPLDQPMTLKAIGIGQSAVITALP